MHRMRDAVSFVLSDHQRDEFLAQLRPEVPPPQPAPRDASSTRSVRGERERERERVWSCVAAAGGASQSTAGACAFECCTDPNKHLLRTAGKMGDPLFEFRNSDLIEMTTS
jgi:hypothetical protein